MCRAKLAELRRRSVDVGGLALALGKSGSGSGWGGWDEEDGEAAEAKYAEMLSDMYAQSQSTVRHAIELPPIDVTPETRARLIGTLDSWEFEPHKLPEEAVTACTVILFEALLRIEGMEEDVGFSLDQLTPFLRSLRMIYRQENSYHNFQHALDVLQATHVFLCSAGIVPSVAILSKPNAGPWKSASVRPGSLVSCLSNTDLFALYVAAIGHDVGHPGFSNVFMKNAKTPLSTVYDDKSALEQMHTTLLLQVMRVHGLGSLLDRPKSGAFFRALLTKTVLATDMSVHFKFMADFAELAKDSDMSVDEVVRKVYVCQALIKCADISNPGRPPGVSRYWANALMVEWTNQAALERHLSLPATMPVPDSPMKEAKSQVFFITTFAKPLFDLITTAIPEMQPYANQCNSNLSGWQARIAELEAEAGMRTNTVFAPPSINTDVAMSDSDPTAVPHGFLSAFPFTLPPDLFNPESAPSSPYPPSIDPHTVPPSVASSVGTSPPASRTPSPVMPGAYVFTPPTLYRTLSSPSSPTSPSSSPRTPHAPDPQMHIRTLSTVSSSAGSSYGGSSAASGASANATAIRAAYKASVRKKKSWHRSSWNPGGSAGSTSPPPPMPSTSPTALLFPRANMMHPFAVPAQQTVDANAAER